MVFEVDFDDDTPMRMVSEAAEKVQKLPKGMHYRLLLINFYALKLVNCSVVPQNSLTDCTGSN